ncbi:MAG: DNA-binding protein [Desulfobacteraceae bacterium]|nr:DNA-binding protein [Desulfobacteraceae bacterium]
MSEEGLEEGKLIVCETEDGRVKLSVRLEDESVWLTRQMMAELYQTSKQNISRHIHIYDEGELQPAATVKKYLTVRQEGDRQVCCNRVWRS